MTSRLLWAFEVQRVVDPETGKPLPIDVTAYHEGISHCPKEFPITFKPRSKAHVDTIMREMNKAKQYLKAWDD